MKAAIYNPYLDTLGGGERYTLSFADVLSSKGYQVDIEWKSKEIISLLEKRFNLKLTNFNIVDSIDRGDGYDVCFWVSDGSIPTLKARKNILHFQVPFHGVNGKSLINKMKLFRISSVICNSNFTKKVIDKEYGLDSQVVYPPVDVINFRPKRKENIILSVGRFSRLMQSKHQDLLIEVFKKFYDLGHNDWRLILAGGAEVGNGGYTDELLEASADYPIKIVKNPDFKTLKELYGKARIYWNASGFGENEERSPEKVEHFGISVVEAMASGCVVFAYRAGGHKEIIKEGNNGYLWTSDTELIRLTEEVIKNKSALREVATKATHSALGYGYKTFRKMVGEIL